MCQFNVSGPYEDYKVPIKCIFRYGDYIVSVKYIFPACPINAALQQQPTVRRRHARSSLRHKNTWITPFGNRTNVCGMRNTSMLNATNNFRESAIMSRQLHSKTLTWREHAEGERKTVSDVIVSEGDTAANTQT